MVSLYFAKVCLVCERERDVWGFSPPLSLQWCCWACVAEMERFFLSSSPDACGISVVPDWLLTLLPLT